MCPLAQANLSYMKLILNSFFVFLFVFCLPVFGIEINKKYTVRVSGITIGSLDWSVKITDSRYLNKINLKSRGLLSTIYSFEGEYFSEGGVKNKNLYPSKYSHVWKTNKKTKSMVLVFRDNSLISLNQLPFEKEHLRIDVFKIKESKDPLTSFLQIIMGEKNSLVVDGRRKYKMNSIIDDDIKKTIVEISDYYNLWADHKRSKFEKIDFEKKIGDLLPNKINIYFDGRVFRLHQD